MARVKCVTMQRDEDLLLEPWLRYYGYLFGFENLVVFDNNSERQGVIETLRFYERLGVDVHWDHRTPEDYQNKGAHFRNIVGHWDNLGDYDFALPVHCDEFLALFTADGVTCTRSALHAHLDALVGARGPLGIDIALNNVPDRPGWFWPEHRPKQFLAAGTAAEIDHRNAALRTEGDEPVVPTELVYLHFHHKPLDALKRHARHKLEFLVDGDPEENWRDYAGPLPHLAAYFGLSEQGYRHRFTDKLLLEVPGLSLLLEGLGITNELLIDPEAEPPVAGHRMRVPRRSAREAERTLRFDTAAYHALHADIGEAGLFALKHYLIFGHAEGREI